ncbi:hypothetical protein [Mycolicibacterium palauense]|uniref:hypothetical protein n=1 Tax=Mycolicibacterium palauense TaxID=2034511 RepID=UPI000BFECF4A|nr:hypothetical protein [Mycolicibacterium palauense]
MNITNPNVPIPAGATADDWPSITEDGVLMRTLTWSEHDTPKVGVSVSAEQRADDGSYTPEISVFGADGIGLSADEARRLAAMLIEAADALEAVAG